LTELVVVAGRCCSVIEIQNLGRCKRHFQYCTMYGVNFKIILKI
jgi:hypothetical protein